MRVALVLLSVVALSPANRGRIIATEATLRQMACGIADFQKTCGWLPTREEGLDVLVHQPTDWPEQVPWTPYLETSEVPHDAWNNEFTYVLDPELAERFGIYSCGQDGVSYSNGNDRDDLNTWSRGKPWLAYYESPWRKGNVRSTIIIVLVSIVLVVAALAVLTWKATQGKTRSPIMKE